jgi:hypothetical protein
MDVQRTGDNVGRLAAAAFGSVTEAEAALQAIVDNGFARDQISIVGATGEEHLLHEWMPAAVEATAETSPNHVALGGLLGGILGGAVALAIPGVGWAAGVGILTAGVASGAFGGGIWGPLTELGMEEERVVYLNERLESGDIIITVHDDIRAQDAQEILQAHGGTTAGIANTQQAEKR